MKRILTVSILLTMLCIALGQVQQGSFWHNGDGYYQATVNGDTVSLLGRNLFIGFIYAEPVQSDACETRCGAEESSVRSVPDEQQDVIRDYLFINTECEFSSSTGSSAVSRIPTKTLQNNIFQRYLDIARQSVKTNIKVFTLRATVAQKRLPFSKNYYIYYLSRIIC